jgi:phage FluMu protein Com
MFKQQGQGKAGHDHRGIKPFRCLCGSMLARLVPGGVELKCKRCKRQVILPLERSATMKMANEI